MPSEFQNTAPLCEALQVQLHSQGEGVRFGDHSLLLSYVSDLNCLRLLNTTCSTQITGEAL